MASTMKRLELALTALGAGAAAWAAYTQLDRVLSAQASEALRGMTAAAALASVVALASMFVGAHWLAGGFVLRFDAAFMVMIFFWFASGVGQVLALTAASMLLFASCLLVVRYRKEGESRGVRRW